MVSPSIPLSQPQRAPQVRKQQLEEIARVGKICIDDLSMGEFFECVTAEGDNKRDAERRVRTEFIGLALDTKDKYFGAALAASNCWQDWVAYTDDQALFSDYWAKELTEIQKSVNHYVKDPFQYAASLTAFQTTLREVLDTIRTETRKKLKVKDFKNYDEIAAYENYGFRFKVQDYILEILDMAHRAVLTLDQFNTCSQVVAVSFELGDKAVTSARFVKEYYFMFHSKWRLRADKISTGIHLKDQGPDDVWDPIYGRCFEDWKDEYVFEEADDLDALIECFFDENRKHARRRRQAHTSA